MKAKKLFLDLSFKRMWNKINELSNKVITNSDAINEQDKNISDIGEAVLLAEVNNNTTKTFDNIDISPYREVLVHGWKIGSGNILQLVGHGLLPTNLMTVNTRIITKYYAGGTDNEHTVTRIGDKSFTLLATGQDNYGTRFYGIK